MKKLYIFLERFLVKGFKVIPSSEPHHISIYIPKLGDMGKSEANFT